MPLLFSADDSQRLQQPRKRLANFGADGEALQKEASRAALCIRQAAFDSLLCLPGEVGSR